jgi:thymidylate synthase ThyX
MRHTDMGDKFNVRMPSSVGSADKVINLENYPALQQLGWIKDSDNGKPEGMMASEIFEAAVMVAREAYAALKAADLPYQDCRMLCPIGTETYIIATYPVSEFLATYSYRACRMFLWEMQHVMKLMREEVIKVFPWMDKFIKVACEKTKRCMYQGWENTVDDCEFEWRGDRVYKPNLDLIGLKGKAYEKLD